MSPHKPLKYLDNKPFQRNSLTFKVDFILMSQVKQVDSNFAFNAKFLPVLFNKNYFYSKTETIKFKTPISVVLRVSGWWKLLHSVGFRQSYNISQKSP